MHSDSSTRIAKALPVSAFVSGFRLFLTSGWRLFPVVIALLVLLPVLVVMSSFASPEQGIWQHLIEYVLGELLRNTFWLVAGVATGTLLLGAGLGWLMAVYRFPGSRILSWALLLPMAIPAYVSAFVFIGLFDFTGPVQNLARELFGSSAWFPRIRSTGGVILVMSLALYPYVYLLAKNAFSTQGTRALEAAQTLGHTRLSGFFKVALPMARPWIIGGLMLVLMETLADFGTVAVFNYDTFTTAIYKTWFGMFSLNAASQIASILVILVFVLLVVEQLSRARMRYIQAGRNQAGEQIRLHGAAAWCASGAAFMVVLIAFVVPTVQLLLWAAEVFAEDFDNRYFALLWHSLMLSAIAAIITTMTALLLAYVRRRNRDRATMIAVRIATIGYALPGPVLAVGIFVAIAWIDHHLLGYLKATLNLEAGALLQGTVLIMLVAYVIRFMAVGFNTVDSAMQRLPVSLDEVSHAMGVNGLAMLRRVHVPILRSGLVTALILVFVDVMKEMPITLMTRPFGWDTLAVRIFEMTSEGEWEKAALPAISLVLAGLIPIILLHRHTEIKHG
ncbi:Putative 2-aminoethylphosphonate transport system permease protein PhnV [Methylophilaceae bacterium]|nr:Putative 2-aminoethylphosphonate transport system permease protein PhnV [Methylophilaceae bacterium]